MSRISPVCPAARPVEGSAPGAGGVVCQIMEKDQARADPILEGAPHGVFISETDDPSTLSFFCCGTAPPSPSPDADPVAHYTSCPVWAAGQELDALERAFAPPKTPETDPEAPDAPVRLAPDDGELTELFGEGWKTWA